MWSILIVLAKGLKVDVLGVGRVFSEAIMAGIAFKFSWCSYSWVASALANLTCEPALWSCPISSPRRSFGHLRILCLF